MSPRVYLRRECVMIALVVTRARARTLLVATVILAFLGVCPRRAASADVETGPLSPPKIAEASDAGQKAIAGFRIPQGMKIDLVAAEPLLANGVCFCFDEHGRIYVAETFRQQQGVEDNRSHQWVDDDLAAQTVADRLAYLKKQLGDKVSSLGEQEDRIRLLEDKDGDGSYETATVFSDGYRDIVEGTGAGLLARHGEVFYSCIPNLWRLRDTTARVSPTKRSPSARATVCASRLRGHDLHGLCMGPDGKMYFSIGDRGFNVSTPAGQLVYPDQGAVLRCNLDGSELEVFHTGLRNPQELAFDDHGNLFTGDNNSDGGDQARWVMIVDGADSGWRMNFQYLSDRGPWNRERLWHTQFKGQAAYVVPPLAHVAAGPSGLACYPGVGLDAKYKGHFFLVDFRGGAGQSGVLSFGLKPKGAAFEVVDKSQFIGGMLATDCDFGPDGALYVLDWVETWTGTGRGRIYRASTTALADDPLVQQTRELLTTDMSARQPAELAALLKHADRRVRQEAAIRPGRSWRRIAATVERSGLANRASASPLARHLGPGSTGREIAVRQGRAVAPVDRCRCRSAGAGRQDAG